MFLTRIAMTLGADSLLDASGLGTTRTSKEAHLKTFEDHPIVWTCGGRENITMTLFLNLGYNGQEKLFLSISHLTNSHFL